MVCLYFDVCFSCLLLTAGSSFLGRLEFTNTWAGSRTQFNKLEQIPRLWSLQGSGERTQKMQWVWVFMRGWYSAPLMVFMLRYSEHPHMLCSLASNDTWPSSVDQGSANCDLQDKSSSLLFLQIEFYWKTVIHTACILSMDVSCHDSRVKQLQQRWYGLQSWNCSPSDCL